MTCLNVKNTFIHVPCEDGDTMAKRRCVSSPPGLRIRSGAKTSTDGPARGKFRSKQGKPQCPRCQSPTSVSGKEVTMVYNAVVSLLDDEMKPEATLINRRLQELYQNNWCTNCLKVVCMEGRERGLRIEEGPPKSGSLFTALVQGGRGGGIVDPKSRDVEFPADIWKKVDLHIAEITSGTQVTSNYELAKLLRGDTRLGLETYTLGRLHQLAHALVEKKIIGHRRVADPVYCAVYLVPYKQSDEFKKLARNSEVKLTKPQLEGRLRTLFADDKTGRGFQLSTLKKRFVRKFGEELDEAQYGFEKLSQLLHDLSTTCLVEAVGTHTIVKLVQPPAAQC